MNTQKINVEYIPSCTWILGENGFECTHDITYCIGVDSDLFPAFMSNFNNHTLHLCIDCDAVVDGDFLHTYDDEDTSAEDRLMRLISGQYS